MSRRQKCIGVLLPIIVAFVVLQTSCTGTQALPETLPPLALLSPDSYGGTASLGQLARLELPDRNLELLLYTEIEHDQLVVAGLLPNGVRVFTVDFDGSRVSSEGVLMPGGDFDPEYFLADLQLALWPLSQLQAHYAGHSACFGTGDCVLQEASSGLRRQLLYRGSPVVSIGYTTLPASAGTLYIEHHRRGYRITITPLETQQP